MPVRDGLLESVPLFASVPGQPRASQGLPLRILRHWQQPAVQRLALLWILNLLVCIVFGLLVVQWQWFAISMHFGGTDLHVTVYPPMILCLLWVMWFGVIWGAIPAYLSTFVLALYSGMPLQWALLFGLADPLGLLVIGTVYRAIQMPVVLNTASQWLFFMAICFIASVFSATGSFVWSHTSQLGDAGLFGIWQGWWLGGFLQACLINGPVMALASPAVLRWRMQHFPQPQIRLMEKWRLLLTSALGVLGVLGFLWLSLFFSTGSLRISQPNSLADWQHLALVTRESTIAVYWVMTVLFLAMVFLGYRFFLHWTHELERAAAKTAAERDIALRRQAEAEAARADMELLNQELAIRMVEVESLQFQLQEQATRDPLTYLYNRRYLHETLPIELQRAQRQQYSVCVVMIDLDYFKAVNDRHGHAVGDAVLVTLAGVLRTGLRAVDFSARYGGEEFCLVLADIDLVMAQQCVEQLQRCYASQHIRGVGGDLTGLTFSAGIACCPLHGADEKSLLRAADRALYKAKADGRNCIRLAPDGLLDAEMDTLA